MSAHFILLIFLQSLCAQSQIPGHSRHLTVKLLGDDGARTKKNSIQTVKANSYTHKKHSSKKIVSSSPIHQNKNAVSNTEIQGETAKETRSADDHIYTIPETRESLLRDNGYVHPQYPRKARVLRQEGTLLVLIDVKEGILHKAELIQSSKYPLLDQTALEAVRKWQFRVVTVRFTQRISFFLN